MTTTPLHRPDYSGPISADATVLKGRVLVAGQNLRDTSTFADDRWDLNPAVHKLHTRSQTLDFTTVPACVRHVSKELFYALLTAEVDGQEVLHVETIRKHFSSVKLFLNWQHDSGYHGLRALTDRDLEKYARYVRQNGGATLTQAHRLRAAEHFWRYRNKLYSDQLSLDPRRLTNWLPNGSTRSSSRSENSTDRIPEQIIGPLLTWALRWTDDFADDLLAAYREWRLLNAQTEASLIRHGRCRTAGTNDRVRRLLSCYKREGRPLPGLCGTPNYSHLAREARTVAGALKHGTPLALIRAAVADLGIADDSYLRTSARATIDGQPWRGPISYYEMPELIRLLQTAAYIVIAYLSGMRDSEVKHLQRGCLSRTMRSDGTIYRRKITSLAFKGESDVRGVSATWVVTESVERAVNVLEQLRDDDRSYLFAHPATSRAYYKTSSNTVATNSKTNSSIADFITWIVDYCDRNGRDDGILPFTARHIKVTTGQFRRTLAWFIAREPGGVIAGAIAYRHAGVQMFEGYAGTSESGFRAEVESEIAVMRAHTGGDLVTSGEHRRLTGPAAKEAEARLDEFARHVVFEGRVITDRKRLQRELDRHNHEIYFGRFVTCVHDPDRALCRRGAVNGEQPSLPDCIPLKCRNVALTQNNRQAIASHLLELDGHIANPDKWAPYVLHRLRSRRDEIETFLARAHRPGQSS